jgi:hypothetical protein
MQCSAGGWVWVLFNLATQCGCFSLRPNVKLRIRHKQSAVPCDHIREISPTARTMHPQILRSQLLILAILGQVLSHNASLAIPDFFAVIGQYRVIHCFENFRQWSDYSATSWRFPDKLWQSERPSDFFETCFQKELWTGWSVALWKT